MAKSYFLLQIPLVNSALRITQILLNNMSINNNNDTTFQEAFINYF